ncbi:MAG: hypothetical protein KF861_21635, partial [Planctomycetaceae bacterium]|nr:hypothetical protein [Planctomycetaceae bacterium]
EIREIRVNKEIGPSRFDIAFSPGTLVINEITGDNWRVSDQPQPELLRHPWLFWMNSCALLIVGMYFLRRRLSMRRQ